MDSGTGQRNQNVATCLPLTRTNDNFSLGIGDYGYRQSLSGVSRLQRGRWSNNLEKTSWGTWWNIWKGISGSGSNKRPEDFLRHSLTHCNNNSKRDSTRLRLLEAPDVASWNSKDSDEGRKKGKMLQSCGSAMTLLLFCYFLLYSMLVRAPDATLSWEYRDARAIQEPACCHGPCDWLPMGLLFAAIPDPKAAEKHLMGDSRPAGKVFMAVL